MEASNADVQDTLRLTPQQVRSIFEALDRRDAMAGEGQDRRAHARRAFSALHPVPFEVAEAGGSTAKHLVIPRELSASGMSVLHGMFVHPGTRCSVMLPSSNGGQARMEGTVKRCRLVAGRVHEIGIKFEIQRTGDAGAASAGSANSAPLGALVNTEDKEARELISLLAAMLSEQAKRNEPGANLQSLVRELSKECARLAA